TCWKPRTVNCINANAAREAGYLPLARDEVLRSCDAFPRGGDADGGHAGCGGGLDAHFGVFKDEAIFRVHSKPFGGEQKWLGIGPAFFVVARANEQIELCEQTSPG